MRGIFALALAALIWFSGDAPAQDAGVAGPRHALVIGVGAYRNIARLPSPERDAEGVADRLRKLGFTVTLARNPTRAELDGALQTFTKTLPRDALAFVYYSGHGVEAGGKNLLLPVDFPHPNRFADLGEGVAPYYMGREALVLDDMLDLLGNARPRNLVVVLDACRNNPLQPDEGKGVAKKELGGQVGLGAISPRAQAYIMYAAGARQKALDRLSSSDKARNSLFTRHLLEEIGSPGLPLDRVFKNAAAKVEKEAREKGGGHRQRPSIYTDVYEDIILIPVHISGVDGSMSEESIDNYSASSPPAVVSIPAVASPAVVAFTAAPPPLPAPRAVNDSYRDIEAGKSYIFPVLENDVAALSRGLRVLSIGSVSRGRAKVTNDRLGVTYTAPSDGKGGKVSFTYKVREDGGGESMAMVTLALKEPQKLEAEIPQPQKTTSITDGPILTDPTGWMTKEKFEYEASKLRNTMEPKSISCAIYNGLLYYKAEYRARFRINWWYQYNTSKEYFEKIHKDRTNEGYERIWIQSCTLNEKTFYNGVWVR